MPASVSLTRLDGSGEAEWALGLAADAAPMEASGEDMVQDFVSLNLRGMLQPFADHLRSLQSEVDRLAADLEATRGPAAAREAQAVRQEDAITALRSSAAESISQIEKALAELAALKREKSRLEGNHEMTKASVAKTKELLAALTTRVDALDHEAAKGLERAAALERSLAEADASLREQFDGRLDKQGRVCKEVSERTAEMLKSCQQARRLGEGASSAVKDLAQQAERRWSEDGQSLEELRGQLLGVVGSVAEHGEALSTHGESLKAADRDLQHLQTWTKQLQEVESLQAQQSQARAALDEQARRLDRAERDLMDVSSEPLRIRQVDDDVNELKTAFGGVAAEVKQLLRWRESHKLHVDVLSTASERLGQVEQEAQALAMQVESVEGQVRGLAAEQQALPPRIEAQEASLKQVQDAVVDVRGQVDGSGAYLKGLRSELDGEHDQLAKLAVRVDACCKYFSGLGKGLQDTHRQIASGEGGLLLPSKAAGGSSLPAIPRTPRALKPVSSSSPRRPPPLACKA